MRRFSTIVVVVLLAGCGKDDTKSSATYDQAELDRFKAALPSESQLSAAAPGATVSGLKADGTVALMAGASAQLLGAPALYPPFARDVASGVNGAVSGMVQLLRAIVDVPPTAWDSSKHQFFWGPWASDTDFGTVAVYIQEQLPTAPAGTTCASGWHLDTASSTCVPDFHFVYALLRGASTDLASLAPVIWGGANPVDGHPDFGSGVTLWDFEANYAFAQANDPGFATKQFARGRFVALYARGPSTNPGDPPTATIAVNVAVFHDFVSQEEPTKAPLEAQYFYGRYDGTYGVGFLDFHALADISGDGSIEDLSVRLAHLDSGVGRAEVSAQCPDGATCSIPTGQVLTSVECWDSGIDRTYFTIGLSGGTPQVEGTEAQCGPVFQNSLDALQIPTLESVDPALMAALEGVAADGIPSGT